ncbi:hypothetical protein AAG570_013394 [Ranatra chinensis]|uniref:Transmembrane protein 223 n=1 Tax=Ranatra chinensis TaxID=642074 RepID=A0ABD0YC18_9HEMI
MNYVRFLSRSALPACYSFSFRRFFGTAQSSNLLDVNTNVVKDVILFKYDNPRYFKLLNIFGITQFGFWMYLANFAFTTLRDAPVPEEKSKNLAWWRRINLGEQKYKNTIAGSCCIVGYCFLFGAWMFTLRSVRYLILRKGGNTVSFVTYGPFGRNRILDIPLNKVSAAESRDLAKVHLPIKVKGHLFYYMLDMRGEFRNKRLFDVTAGLKRNLEKAT